MSPAAQRDDAGFTVVELAIVMAIASLVMTALLGMLDSQTKASQRVTRTADSQELVREALVAAQRDLRSAEPLVVLADRSAYPTTVELLHTDFDTGASSRLRWRLDVAQRELVREQLDATTGAVVATTFRLRGVTSTTAFRYFDRKGSELQPTTATSATIARCAARVRISIVATPSTGSATQRTSSDVQLRNRRPGSTTCAA